MDDALKALMVIINCVEPKSLSELIKESLADKNPQLKINLMVWICQLIDENQDMIEQFTFVNACLQKLIADPDKLVRV